MLSCLWIRLIPALAELGVEICVKARRFWSYVVQAHNLYFLTHVHQSSRATSYECSTVLEKHSPKHKQHLLRSAQLHISNVQAAILGVVLKPRLR